MKMISVFSVQLSPYALLLLTVSVVGDDCIKKNCDKTWAIPSNENLTIKVSPCDKCTNCDSPFETQNIVTVHAWWYYKLPNGSRTEDINARVIDNRDYEIKLVDHPSLVTKGPHTIYTGYDYQCEGLYSFGGSLKDIEITLIAAIASIDRQNQMPVLEGGTVEIWCETGLSDSRVVDSTFQFRGRSGDCPLEHNPNPNPNPVFGGYSSWSLNRKATEPYTCGLFIENIQPSDTGDYYCEVNVHKAYIMGTTTPMKSSPLHIELTSPNSTTWILEIVIPAVAGGVGVVLLIVILVVCCVVCYYCRRRHPDNQPQPLPDGPPHAQNPPPPGAGDYGALGVTPPPSEHSQGSVEQSRSTGQSARSSGGSEEHGGNLSCGSRQYLSCGSGQNQIR